MAPAVGLYLLRPRGFALTAIVAAAPLVRPELALALAASFVGLWLAGGIELGRGPGGDVGYLLWSGWIALALYLAVIAYVGRKYVHRLRGARRRSCA